MNSPEHTRERYLHEMILFDGQKMTRPPHDTGHCTETKVIYVMLWRASNGGERDTLEQWTVQWRRIVHRIVATGKGFRFDSVSSREC